MGEHLAGSTHRILIWVFSFYLCVFVCECVCMDHTNVCSLLFCLITFLTGGFDNSKQNTPIIFFVFRIIVTIIKLLNDNEVPVN